MAKVPGISEAEWEVMAVVWARGGAVVTANEVVEALSPKRGWSPRTVKSMLNRLVKKGALGFEAEGKRYLYRARVTREQCVREESRSFLGRVFGGAVGPMLNHFVQNETLSEAEVQELRRMLDERRGM